MEKNIGKKEKQTNKGTDTDAKIQTYRCSADKMVKLLERKKNGQIKVLISHMWLIL